MIGEAPIETVEMHTGGEPVRIIVPYPPGGGTDVVARTVAPKLGDALGQQVIVDNRPSAGGIVAAQTVANAAPSPRVTVFMNRLKRQGGLAEKGSGLLVFPALATLAESGGNRRRANEAPDHLGRLLASVAAGTPVTYGSECV